MSCPCLEPLPFVFLVSTGTKILRLEQLSQFHCHSPHVYKGTFWETSQEYPKTKLRICVFPKATLQVNSHHSFARLSSLQESSRYTKVFGQLILAKFWHAAWFFLYQPSLWIPDLASSSPLRAHCSPPSCPDLYEVISMFYIAPKPTGLSKPRSS